MEVEPRIRHRSRPEPAPDADPGRGGMDEYVRANPGVPHKVDENGNVTLTRVGDFYRFVELHYGKEAATQFREARLAEYTMAGVPVPEMCRRFDKSPKTIYRWIERMRERQFERWKSVDPWDVHVSLMEEVELMRQACHQEMARAGGDRMQAVGRLTMVQRNWLYHLRHGGLYDVLNLKGGRGDEGMSRAHRIRKRLRAVIEAAGEALGDPVLPALHGGGDGGDPGRDPVEAWLDGEDVRLD